MTDAELERLLVLDAGEGPAPAIDAAHEAAMIEAVLDGAGFGPGGGPGSGAGAPGGIATGTKLAILGGAALLVVAIVLLVGRGRHHDAPVAAAPADAAIDAPIDAAGSGTTLAAPHADASPAEVTIDMTDVAPAPETPKRTPQRRESAADLLGEANAKRAAKQRRESDALYARVVERAPKSLAAQSALIASASLHLEHLGDPKGAAQRFRRALALAPSGALAEEARWGIAEAARATKDRVAEAAALDDFLAHHGTSPLAGRAKARRAELP